VVPEVPWCPGCEWNLGAFEPPQDHSIPKRFIRRAGRDHRRAYALDAAMFSRMTQEEATRPGVTGPWLILQAASILLVVATAALFGAGIWLLMRPPYLPGLALIAVAIELRPRFDKLEPTDRAVTAGQAPVTFGLLARVAAAVGAPCPRTLHVDAEFNAYCGRSGLLRHPVLGLGLPLWASLSPQARVALLGHELGHLVNGDPRRGLLTQPALTTFGRLAELFDPVDMPFRSIWGNESGLMRLLGTLILAPFTWVCDRIHLFLLGISARDSRRAEYLADRLAIRAGGLDAAQELLRTLLAGSAVRIMVRRSALASAEPSEWLAAADLGRAEVRAGMREREQRSIRLGAALLASHPATGLRSRLLNEHAVAAADVVVGADEWAASDAELAGDYARAQRALQRGPAF
jgi:heat shock protein HtpX